MQILGETAGFIAQGENGVKYGRRAEVKCFSARRRSPAAPASRGARHDQPGPLPESRGTVERVAGSCTAAPARRYAPNRRRTGPARLGEVRQAVQNGNKVRQKSVCGLRTSNQPPRR